MARPRTRPGSWGTITVTPTTNGRYIASGGYRRLDGYAKRHKRTGNSPEAARDKLLREVSEYPVIRTADSVGGLDHRSTVQDLADYWLVWRELGKTVTHRTLADDRRGAGTVVQEFGAVRIDEVTTAQVEMKVAILALSSQDRAKRCRAAFIQMMDLALKFGLIHHNPVARVTKPRTPARVPVALTHAQLGIARDAFRLWPLARMKPGPKRDPRFADMMDVLIATGIRRGELLALRMRDIDLNPDKPTVFIGATLSEGSRGEPVWKAEVKGGGRGRYLTLPRLGVAAVRLHLDVDRPDDPLFPSKTGSWMRPNKLCATLRTCREEMRVMLEEADIHVDGFTMHSFRRSIATLIAHSGGVDRAKEQLGHASIKTTEEHYVMPKRDVGFARHVIDDLFD